MEIFNQAVEMANYGDIVEMHFDLKQGGSLDVGMDAIVSLSEHPLKLTETLSGQVIIFFTEEPIKVDDKFIFYAGG